MTESAFRITLERSSWEPNVTSFILIIINMDLYSDSKLMMNFRVRLVLEILVDHKAIDGSITLYAF